MTLTLVANSSTDTNHRAMILFSTKDTDTIISSERRATFFIPSFTFSLGPKPAAIEVFAKLPLVQSHISRGIVYAQSFMCCYFKFYTLTSLLFHKQCCQKSYTACEV